MKLDRFLDRLVSPLARILERREDPLPQGGVDVVVGFGIGMRADGSPSLISRAVAVRCAILYKQKLARTIIFTGGSSESNITEAEAMRSIAIWSFGIPSDEIFIDNASKNTHQNALNVWAMLKRKGLAKNGLRFAVVGQDLHVGRCYDSLRRVVPKSSRVFLLKAYSRYDPECTQKRLTAEWRFIPWEIIWTVLFKIKFVRRLIS